MQTQLSATPTLHEVVVFLVTQQQLERPVISHETINKLFNFISRDKQLTTRILEPLRKANLLGIPAVAPKRNVSASYLLRVVPHSEVFSLLPESETFCIHTNVTQGKIRYLRIHIGPHTKCDNCLPVPRAQAQALYNAECTSQTFSLYFSEGCIRHIREYSNGDIVADLFDTDIKLLLRSGVANSVAKEGSK